MTKRDGGSARKFRALGYPAHARLPFGTNSHGRCQHCGKLNFGSRDDARRAARVHHPGDRDLRAYRCPETDQWHYGHIPEWKAQGYESAAEWRAAQEGQQGEPDLQPQGGASGDRAGGRHGLPEHAGEPERVEPERGRGDGG